jgi:ElaB/YqjD/DUF883 family membrane-anchored ribosome-binding protein
MAKNSSKSARNAGAHAAAALQDLIDTAEELLEDLRSQQGAAVDALREKVSATVEAARSRLEALAPDVQEAASATLDSAVSFVRKDPWRAVALGAITLLAFSLIGRLGDDD